jgi:DNA-binding MarR family transcriptional regulator
MKNQVRCNGKIEHQKLEEGEKNLAATNGKRHRLSATEVEALLSMYRAGTETTAKIAERYGLTTSSVTNLAKRAGLHAVISPN